MATQALVQLVHKHSSYYHGDGGYVWARQRGHPLVKVVLVIATAEWSTLKATMTNAEPQL